MSSEAYGPSKRALTLRSWRGTRQDLVTLAKTVVAELDRAKTRILERQDRERQLIVRQEETNLANTHQANPQAYARGIAQLRAWEAQQQQLDQATVERMISIIIGYETHDGKLIAGPDPDIYTKADFPQSVRAIVMQGTLFSLGAAVSVYLNLRNQPYVDLSLTVEGRGADSEWASAVYERLSQALVSRASPVVGFIRHPVTQFIFGVTLWSLFAIQIAGILPALPFDVVRYYPWLSILFAIVPVSLVSSVYTRLSPAFALNERLAAFLADVWNALITGLVGLFFSLLFLLIQKALRM